MIIDERERRKRPSETDLDWRQRIEKLDQDQRDRGEPIITAEAERQGEYRDEFVMHVETQTLARTKRNRHSSPLDRMFHSGAVTPEQYLAGQAIIATAERIGRGVGLASSKLEERVDGGRGSASFDEGNARAIWAEQTYNRWRSRLPMPRRLVLDMLTLNQPMANTARSYRISWPKARKRLTDALDTYLELREQVGRELDIINSSGRIRSSGR